MPLASVAAIHGLDCVSAKGTLEHGLRPCASVTVNIWAQREWVCACKWTHLSLDTGVNMKTAGLAVHEDNYPCEQYSYRRGKRKSPEREKI